MGIHNGGFPSERELPVVTELEMEIYPVLDELASSFSTLNLEHVRRLKGQLLALTRRVQKVCGEIEHRMNDDRDMAEMYLMEKKKRMEAYSSSDRCFLCNSSSRVGVMPKSAPISPVGSISGIYQLQRVLSTVLSSSKHGNLMGSSNNGQNIKELEMLLEAYFVVTQQLVINTREFCLSNVQTDPGKMNRKILQSVIHKLSSSHEHIMKDGFAGLEAPQSRSRIPTKEYCFQRGDLFPPKN
ncbi:hypothetical protein HHK36_024457 [Tetracentron sinense]|uniref:Uncharacterized protein n=1 Tax=Tetracentron sinense TaxID=13715 RepID=A0A835D497_TETSI|nr:hypothetical protein HHK36_024457 [Tetracentron sinense]